MLIYVKPSMYTVKGFVAYPTPFNKIITLRSTNLCAFRVGNCQNVKFTLKCCFDSTNDGGVISCNSGSGGLSKGGEVFVSRSQLIGDGIRKEGSGGDGSDGFRSRDKIVVAVDVDEVLGDFVSVLNRFVAERYSLNHSVSEYHVYEFFKVWNCSPIEADIRVHEFFKTPYFRTGIRPIPGAQKAVHQLSRFCNLSVVTSRQNTIKDHTIEWIEKHFPGLFREIHFGNHFSLDGESKPKSEICKSLGAEILIDDNPKYAIECAELGINVLLFDYNNSYPWCKTESVDQHPLVTRVHNWEDVKQQLKAWIQS